MNIEKLLQLRDEVHEELIGNILPFWMDKMVDIEHGGFYGQMTGSNQLVPDAPKGAILTTRLLWTFASAARHLEDERYTEYARIAKAYLFAHFFDLRNGGIYWSVAADGSPLETRKWISAQAFALYALVEYYRLTNDQLVLSAAIGLYRLIEEYGYDSRGEGYHELFRPDWTRLEDANLNKSDTTQKKSMNTHLHVLEAYTNLYRVWKDAELKLQLKKLVELFLFKMINPETHHLDLFFDANWQCHSSLISYGYDIEVSWLLEDAAVELGDELLMARVRGEVVKIAIAAFEGMQPDGSLINEKEQSAGSIDCNCLWWAQAEAMVGYLNAWELIKRPAFLEAVLNSWDFIRKNLIDHENGEWFWAVNASGIPDTQNDKAGLLKSPCHNARMCLEVMRRVDRERN